MGSKYVKTDDLQVHDWRWKRKSNAWFTLTTRSDRLLSLQSMHHFFSGFLSTMWMRLRLKVISIIYVILSKQDWIRLTVWLTDALIIQINETLRMLVKRFISSVNTVKWEAVLRFSLERKTLRVVFENQFFVLSTLRRNKKYFCFGAFRNTSISRVSCRWVNSWLSKTQGWGERVTRSELLQMLSLIASFNCTDNLSKDFVLDSCRVKRKMSWECCLQPACKLDSQYC